MNFICEKHDQRDWDCYKIGDVATHLMKIPKEFRNTNQKFKQIRCLDCMCKNMDKQTDEIDYCEFYNV